MSLEEVKRFYFRLKEQVFKGKGILGLFGFGCDSKRLEELLKEVFGTEMRMTDKQHPKYVFFSMLYTDSSDVCKTMHTVLCVVS